MKKAIKWVIGIVAVICMCMLLSGFTFSIDSTDNYNPMYQIEETYISGHKYVVAYGKRGVTGISIIHSESCSCKNK